MRTATLVLCTGIILFCGLALGNDSSYEMRKLEIILDKSEEYYTDYEIPASEKLFTKDVRIFNVSGAVYDPHLVITEYDWPKTDTPQKLLSKYLFLGKTKSWDRFSSIYHPESLPFLTELSEETVDRALELNSKIKEIQLKLIVELDSENVVAYGYQVIEDNLILIPYIMACVGDNWKLLAGEMKCGFCTNLANALHNRGTKIIRIRQE